jgi:hypothetical protein
MTGPYAEAAKVYFSSGWANPIPVREKRFPVPGFTGYRGEQVSFPDITAWLEGPEAGHNIALRMAGTVAIDIDAHDGEIGNVTIQRAQARLGDLPPTWSTTARGPGQSRIMIYKLPVGCGDLHGELSHAEKHVVREFGPNVEVLHRGHRYAMVWPSVHPETGQLYRWYLPNGELSAEPPKVRDLAELPIGWWDFLTRPADDAPPVVAADDAYMSAADGGSSLFGPPARQITANTKTMQAAADLLVQQRDAFVALTSSGNGRTQKLNNLALLAGHGVPDFWTHEAAQETLLAAARDSGYVGEHGERTALVQIQRGLADGARNPWTKIEVTYTAPLPAEPVTGGDVEALLAEMLTADQMVQRPAPEYLIKGLLNLDSEAWIIGEPGCKKSFVVLDMCVHVVRGMPWRGLKVRRGPVVMIVAEGAGGTSTRVKAWQQEYGQIGEGLYMLPRPVQAADRRAWAVLAQACVRLGAVMVVIDTQARVTVGLKENDATDMGVYVDAVSMMRELTKACVFTVHHTGRNGGDARGSSAIDGAQGTELKVLRSGPYEGVLKVEKQKDMEERPDLPLSFKRVVVGQDEDGDEITSLVLVGSDEFTRAAGEEQPEEWETGHGEAQVKLIKVLRDQGGQTGLTKAEARAVMIERFYGRDAKRLPRSTWATAWAKVMEKRNTAGDPIAVNAGGARYVIDEVALELLAPPE